MQHASSGYSKEELKAATTSLTHPVLLAGSIEEKLDAAETYLYDLLRSVVLLGRVMDTRLILLYQRMKYTPSAAIRGTPGEGTQDAITELETWLYRPLLSPLCRCIELKAVNLNTALNELRECQPSEIEKCLRNRTMDMTLNVEQLRALRLSRLIVAFAQINDSSVPVDAALTARLFVGAEQDVNVFAHLLVSFAEFDTSQLLIPYPVGSTLLLSYKLFFDGDNDRVYSGSTARNANNYELQLPVEVVREYTPPGIPAEHDLLYIEAALPQWYAFWKRVCCFQYTMRISPYALPRFERIVRALKQSAWDCNFDIDACLRLASASLETMPRTHLYGESDDQEFAQAISAAVSGGLWSQVCETVSQLRKKGEVPMEATARDPSVVDRMLADCNCILTTLLEIQKRVALSRSDASALSQSSTADACTFVRETQHGEASTLSAKSCWRDDVAIYCDGSLRSIATDFVVYQKLRNMEGPDDAIGWHHVLFSKQPRQRVLQHEDLTNSDRSGGAVVVTGDAQAEENAVQIIRTFKAPARSLHNLLRDLVAVMCMNHHFSVHRGVFCDDGNSAAFKLSTPFIPHDQLPSRLRNLHLSTRLPDDVLVVVLSYLPILRGPPSSVIPNLFVLRTSVATPSFEI